MTQRPLSRNVNISTGPVHVQVVCAILMIMAEALIAATIAFLSATATTIMITAQDMGFNHVAGQGPVSRINVTLSSATSASFLKEVCWFSRNKRGQLFGFVRFTHVRDVAKLNKALNNVVFGHLKVWAAIACFNRFGGVSNNHYEGGKRNQLDDKLCKVKIVEELELGLSADVFFEDLESDSTSEFSNPDEVPEHEHIIDSLVHNASLESKLPPLAKGCPVVKLVSTSNSSTAGCLDKVPPNQSQNHAHVTLPLSLHLVGSPILPKSSHLTTHVISTNPSSAEKIQPPITGP
ncbi:transmembrane protein, putative [Medicago truncatula]|uniref:Transmembrane protein, putative n=1 Tax=Medicago truncatula TaxID=3880 RepID=A0A072TVP1_MEDTR|nr:transmembrane protein, putative [Medicago truncatula]